MPATATRCKVPLHVHGEGHDSPITCPECQGRAVEPRAAPRYRRHSPAPAPLCAAQLSTTSCSMHPLAAPHASCCTFESSLLSSTHEHPYRLPCLPACPCPLLPGIGPAIHRGCITAGAWGATVRSRAPLTSWTSSCPCCLPPRPWPAQPPWQPAASAPAAGRVGAVGQHASAAATCANERQ